MKRRRKLILLIFAILILTSARLIIPQKLIINSISCKSQFGPCPSNISDQLNSFAQSNINNANHQSTQLLNSLSQVSDYKIEFNPPSSLSIEIALTKPSFAVTNKDSGPTALVSNSGLVLGFTDSTALPEIILSDIPPDVGEKVDDLLITVSQIQSFLLDNYGVQRGSLKPDGYTTTLPSGIEVIFPPDGNVNLLITSLQLILSQVKIDDEIPQMTRQIDLRYENPILR